MSSSEGSAPSSAEEVEIYTPTLSHSEGLSPEAIAVPPSPAVAKVSSACVTEAPNTVEKTPDPVVSESLEPALMATKTEDVSGNAITQKGGRFVTPKSDDGAASGGNDEGVLRIGNKEEPAKAEGIDDAADRHDIIQEEAGSPMDATIKATIPSEETSPMEDVDYGKVSAARRDNTCVRNDESRTSVEGYIAETEAMNVQNAKKAKEAQYQVPMPIRMAICEHLVHQEEGEVAKAGKPSRENDLTLLSRAIDLRVTPKDAPVTATDTGLDNAEDSAPKEAKVIKSQELAAKKHCPMEALRDKEKKNCTPGDDEKSAVETPKAAPPREWPAPAPHGPRGCYPSGGYQHSRSPLDYDELQRLNLQLTKTRNDLDHERKVNAEIQKTNGAEKQASIGAAMSNMLTDLLNKQAEALTERAQIQEKERNLNYREQKIAQLEVYLSDGQRQLKYQLEQQGIRPMSVVEQANLRRELEIKVRHQLSDIEGKISIQVERLRHQEAAQKIREQQYKLSVCEAIEAEVRAQVTKDEQAKIADDKAAEVACGRGVAEGKGVTGINTSVITLEQEFLKGYAACSRSQVALYNMRSGLLATDSPKLAFLYDPTHPENLHNIGVRIGRMDFVSEKVKAEAIESRKDGANTAVTHRGRGQAEFSNPGVLRSTQTVDYVKKAHEMHRSKQLQGLWKEQQEQPIRK
ncbi:hypothetical protein N0V95_004651 [Ascochyta clinopodiicola]|nr:hypothetical protein N0V95_004651 [Ascochyta clinopodiicola]